LGGGPVERVQRRRFGDQVTMVLHSQIMGLGSRLQLGARRGMAI
jgi:hypothetical protein